MGKVFNLGPDAIDKADTPELIGLFYEWGRRTNAVLDDYFQHNFSDFLIWSAMNAQNDRPPNFVLVGSRAATRKKLGDQWADNAAKTQKSPVNKLDEVTAGGYINSLKYGYSYDVVDIKDDKIATTYRRLILPIRPKLHSGPLFFAMLMFFDEFSRLSNTPDDAGHPPLHKKAKNLH